MKFDINNVEIDSITHIEQAMLHILSVGKIGVFNSEKMGDQMEKGQTPQPKIICASVFKSGEKASIKKQMTSKWIELINQIEKNKGALATVQQ